MTADLTPALALAYLAELEPALQALAVAGSDGTTLAGDPSLVPELAAGAERLISASAGVHVVIARVGPAILEDLVRHDLEAVARELG